MSKLSSIRQSAVRTGRLFLFLVLALVLAGCGAPTAASPEPTMASSAAGVAQAATLTYTPTVSATPTAAFTATRTFTPAPTSTPTPAPTLTPTPVPALPVLAGTAFPQPLQAIAPENASQMVELARMGRGKPRAVRPSSDGKHLFVVSTDGMSIYDTQTLKGRAVFQALLSTRHSLDCFALSENGGRFAYFDPLAAIVLIGDAYSGETLYQIPIEMVQPMSRPRMSFSPDGRVLAIKNYDKLSLWNVPEGHFIFQDQVSSGYAFSPDSATIALANNRSVIEVRKLSDGEAVMKLSGPPDFRNLAYSRDGKLLAVAYRNTTWVWNMSNGSKQFDLYGPTGGSSVEVAFSENGKFLFVQGASLRVWNLDDGRQMVNLAGQTNPVISEDGTRLATLSGDHMKPVFTLWDTEDAAPIFTRKLKQPYLNYLMLNNQLIMPGYNEDKDSLYINNYDKAADYLEIRNISDGKLIRTEPVCLEDIYLLPGGGSFLTWSERDGIYIWDAQNVRITQSTGFTPSFLEYYRNPGFDELFSGWNEQFVGSSTQEDKSTALRMFLHELVWRSRSTNIYKTPDQKLGFWLSGSKIRFYKADENGVIMGGDEKYFAFEIAAPGNVGYSTLTFDGNYLIATVQRTLLIWRVSDGQLVSQMTLKGESEYSIFSFQISPKGTYFAVASEGSNEDYVYLWDIASLKLLHTEAYPTTLRTKTGSQRCWEAPVAFSPDETQIALGGQNCNLQFIQVAGWKKLGSIDAGVGVSGKATFSPDGKLLVTFFESGQIDIWNAMTRELLYTLPTHYDRPDSAHMGFTSDGKVLVIANPFLEVGFWGVWP